MVITFIILFGVLIFAAVNFFIAKANDKRKTKLGIAMLILSPVVFYGTLQFLANFDNGGFGAAIFAMLYGVLFFINGLIVLWISA